MIPIKIDQIYPKVKQLSAFIFHSDPAGSVPFEMDKACYDTFETYDTDSEYDGKHPNKAVEQVRKYMKFWKNALILII